MWVFWRWKCLIIESERVEDTLYITMPGATDCVRRRPTRWHTKLDYETLYPSYSIDNADRQESDVGTHHRQNPLNLFQPHRRTHRRGLGRQWDDRSERQTYRKAPSEYAVGGIHQRVVVSLSKTMRKRDPVAKLGHPDLLTGYQRGDVPITYADLIS